jgi:hypothetical protein
MTPTLPKANFTQSDEFSLISHKELATLLRETATMLEQGDLAGRGGAVIAVGKIGEPGSIRVDFDFTVGGEVRSIGLGSK